MSKSEEVPRLASHSMTLIISQTPACRRSPTKLFKSVMQIAAMLCFELRGKSRINRASGRVPAGEHQKQHLSQSLIGETQPRPEPLLLPIRTKCLSLRKPLRMN
jgi:hypothetical protein